MHVIQRGNNRQACFFSDDDYRCYLEWLGDASRDTGCSIHAYVLMTNHVHLLLSAHDAGGVGGMMKALGQGKLGSVPYFPLACLARTHPHDHNDHSSQKESHDDHAS